MGKLKNMLKHVLPPPVNAFNREINLLRQLILEQNKAQMVQIDEICTKFVGGGLVNSVMKLKT